MQKLLIKDFSLQSLSEFERPVSDGRNTFPALADRMLEAFSFALRPEDVSVLGGANLYDHRMVFKMFNGSADVTLGSKSVITNFRDGRTQQALAFVAKSVDSIYSILVNRPVRTNQLTFAVHVEFDSTQSFTNYMAAFVDTKEGHTSGGRIIQAEGRHFNGEVRFSFEKSLLLENGLYVNAQFFTKDPLGGDMPEKMEKRFTEITQHEGFEIAFPETLK